MTQVTHTQLQNLIDNSGLTTGEIYVITDYPNYTLSMTAVSVNELSDEAINHFQRDSLVFHYVPSTNTVDYMKDTYRLIEGNFDWTDNIFGNCRDIHLGDSAGLIVRDCVGVLVEGVVIGVVDGCESIVLKDGCLVDISDTNCLTAGRDNNLTITGCSGIMTGDDNEITLNGVSNLAICDRNTDINIISGVNIIGSDNRNLTIDGDSNVVKSGNIDIELAGSCNSVDRTKYLRAYGSYNTTDKTTLATLDTAYANEIKNSHSVNIKNTNNNIVRADAIEVKDKPAFVKYATTGSVTRVENLSERVNMQADSTAVTLIVDEQKMWQSAETKAAKHYILVDGVWTDVS